MSVKELQYFTGVSTSVINALETDQVVLSSPILPDYFIKGAKYTIDPVLAYQYTAVPTDPVPAKTYMKADGGEYVEVDYKAVTINANSTVQFKYEYGTGLVESEVIKVVDVGFDTPGQLSIKDYFHTEQDVVTKSATTSYAEYETKGVPAQVELDYINPLTMSSFDFEFTLLSKNKAGTTTYAAPRGITLTFTDYYDRSNVATFTLRGVPAGVYVDVNGVKKVGQLFERKFLDIKTYIKYSNGVLVMEGAEYDLGTTFSGDRILFSVTLETAENAEQESCMRVSLLCDNKLSSATKDNTKPKLKIEELNTGYQSLNKVIRVSKAVASDILAPYVESGLTLTVKNPDGTYAVSEDGVALDGTCAVDRDYYLKLSQVGTYSVMYNYVDQNGNPQGYSYSPIVKDEQGPTITVNGKVENEVVSAKWGASVKVATYSVSDDISSADKIKSYINVIYPSSIMRTIQNGGSFYAEEKGKYRVVYFAYDEIGNVTMFTYYVQVA